MTLKRQILVLRILLLLPVLRRKRVKSQPSWVMIQIGDVLSFRNLFVIGHITACAARQNSTVQEKSITKSMKKRTRSTFKYSLFRVQCASRKDRIQNAWNDRMRSVTKQCFLLILFCSSKFCSPVLSSLFHLFIYYEKICIYKNKLVKLHLVQKSILSWVCFLLVLTKNPDQSVSNSFNWN